MAPNIYKKATLPLLIASLLSYSPTNYADETEIYFTDTNNSIKPNVLFVLDVSGSMADGLNGKPSAATNPSRISFLKTALEQIISGEEIKNSRLGIMTFTTPASTSQAELPIILAPQPILDMSTPDTSLAMEVTKEQDGSFTLTQRLVDNNDDGYQSKLGVESLSNLTSESDFREGLSINAISAYRFANVLLKNPTTVVVSTINNAKLLLPIYVMSDNQTIDLKISIEPVDNSSKLRADITNNLGSRLTDSLASQPSGTQANSVECKATVATKGYSDLSCDVTQLIKDHIARSGWQEGNALTLVTQKEQRTWSLEFQENSSVQNKPLLTINTATKELIAENKATVSQKMIEVAMNLRPLGGTPIVDAMVLASKYISNIPRRSPGPYHAATLPNGPRDAVPMPDSPITADCQLTHLVLMTDGKAEGGRDVSVTAGYMGQNKDSCQIYTNNDSDPAKWKDNPIKESFPPATNQKQQCGPALASWMARTSHSEATGNDGNYVYTHTIGFTLDPNSEEQSFLNQLATYGRGNAYNANNATELTQAFKSIVQNTLIITAPSASGQVSLGPQGRYDQRSEAFYSLFRVANTDYWLGNVKGFQVGFKKRTLSSGQTVEQAVLLSWNKSQQAMGTDGSFQPVATAWANDIADGRDINTGGVLGQLAVPDDRKPYTIIDSKSVELKASASEITTTLMGLTSTNATETEAKAEAEARRKGLLDFIHGYTYQDNGSSTSQNPKKMGETNHGVTLVSYGCNSPAATPNQKITQCDFNNLTTVGIVATNDGFLRGYNMRTGKVLYEFMPQEMLPIINKLQTAKALNQDIVKTYGLDGRVVVYHDDTNQDGYINKDEQAYALVAAGRGGPYLYLLNITNSSDPKLIETITNKTSGFEQLSNTWSTPVVGKIKQGKTTIPVAIFGGGYDESKDTTPAVQTSKEGNTVYMIDIRNGTKLWQANNMAYSVAGAVGVLTDDNKKNPLITDFFVGDLGGRLWRFKVNNGNTEGPLVSSGGGENGMVADISGGNRRFYQQPMIYKLPKQDTISVNLGTGYKLHPLAKETEDRFYSFRLPLIAPSTSETTTETDPSTSETTTETDPSTSETTTETDPSTSKIITEKNLVAADPKNTDKPLDITKGFMVKLATDGEKVVSNAFADVDRLRVDSYIPATTSTKSCTPSIGTQRTYYFELSTGKSLLKTGYVETTSAALPTDAVAYCNKNYCTIIGNASELAGNENNMPDAAIFKNPNNRGYIKGSWTDLFTP